MGWHRVDKVLTQVNKVNIIKVCCLEVEKVNRLKIIKVSFFLVDEVLTRDNKVILYRLSRSPCKKCNFYLFLLKLQIFQNYFVRLKSKWSMKLLSNQNLLRVLRALSQEHAGEHHQVHDPLLRPPERVLVLLGENFWG